MKRVSLALLLAAWTANTLGAQPVARTEVSADSLAVGDVFHATVRVEVPAEARVAFPDTLEVPADVEAAGRFSLATDTAGPGRLRLTARYPLTAWRPGAVELPPVWVQVETGGVVDSIAASFPATTVFSVLPADTAGIEARPVRDVLGANRLWWPLVLALLALIGALGALLWWWRHRRPAAPAVLEPHATPREVALAALDRARKSGLVETGAYKAFYSQVTEILRQYVEALNPQWGADLTTSEITLRMRGQGVDSDAAVLIGLLGRADLVKFARVQTTREASWKEWEEARSFVTRFGGPPPVPEVGEAIAA